MEGVGRWIDGSNFDGAGGNAVKAACSPNKNDADEWAKAGQQERKHVGMM